jgi:hypothetical protein
VDVYLYSTYEKAGRTYGAHLRTPDHFLQTGRTYGAHISEPVLFLQTDHAYGTLGIEPRIGALFVAKGYQFDI